MSDFEYLDSERRKLWAKFIDLEKLLKKKSSENENDARDASINAKALLEDCQKSQQEFSALLKDVTDSAAKVRIDFSEVENNSREIAAIHQQTADHATKVGVSIEEI